MKTTSLLIVLFVAGLCLVGCTTVRYMETETPPGQIPAPPPAPVAPVAPPHQSSYVPPAQGQRGPEFVGDALGMRAGTTCEASTSDLSAGTMARFRAAYSAKKNPKIAVLLNRQLSDDVREWVTDSRLFLAGGYSETKTVAGEKTEQTDVTSSISGYSQQHADSGARHSPNERWMWAFEDGFIQPLLQSGAKMVDRATIVRLAAASSEKQGSAYTPMSVKQVEMDALKGYADIFVEILISRSPSSLYGYEFKASAKEVNTGIIIANVTSLRWRPENRKQREVYATSQGYEVVDSVKIPPVADIASDLAIDLMNAIARAWGE